MSPYAIREGVLTEREYPCEEHPWRTNFQRDRDRIVHCAAFRRLEYKTQVFVNHLGDNYRTRLTHSIEVAQISRTVGRALGLNEDLCETLALAHDLGHPPFGHAGEKVLQELMKDHGGFDHNEQTLRIVCYLEERYPHHPGLNLMKITLYGLQKHKVLPGGLSHSLEAQVVDYCDEIAYNNHDIDDGIASGLLKLEELDQVELWDEFFRKVKKAYPHASQLVQIRQTIRELTNFMVSSLLEKTRSNLYDYNIQTVEDVLYFGQRNLGKNLVEYPEEVAYKIKQLKHFLYEKLYYHPEIEATHEKSKQIICDIFGLLERHPHLLPQDYLKRGEKEGLYRTIADFIAGMTDRYAEKWLSRHLVR
ncbi:MAG: deoxyguanosinetriphosphate triphosphohydrolase [Leptospiraceae bacterium]|nr:deoxyguanosinetriphosphate triphosphohydrolase [Leptospiraceae bacterium]MDW8307525.1 deoxyguanosinetriphosphate triphosphohydrolase [Leptospiraceae bacterium]